MENKNNTDNTNNIIKEAEKSILFTLLAGLIIGTIGLIGYPVTNAGIGIRLMFIGLLLAVATFVTGFFIGTLFGMPKRNNGKDSDYTLNNSLVEISDWLTKIIVGLGLVNLKQIPAFLISLGIYVRDASGSMNNQSVDVFAMCVVVYFGVLGLYVGYNYMRLVLSQKYKAADDIMIRKELETVKKEKVQKEKEVEKFKNIVKEKEEQSKTLMDLVNQPTILLDNLDSTIKKIVNSNDLKDDEITIKTFIDNMLNKAKSKLQMGLVSNKIDPQKGQWNGKVENNERQLTASVYDAGKGLFQIDLKVSSTDSSKYPLESEDLVLFALHNSYGSNPFRLVKVEDGFAELELYSYGSFTVGAFVDKGKTELELDLAELPGVSEYFKKN